MAKGLIQLFFAVLFLIASVYCMLWLLSSASLAPAGCYGNFLRFHSEIRCRQPYIAVILWIGATVTSIVLTVAACKTIKEAGKSSRPPSSSAKM